MSEEKQPPTDHDLDGLSPEDAKRVRDAKENGTFSGWRSGPKPAPPGSPFYRKPPKPRKKK